MKALKHILTTGLFMAAAAFCTAALADITAEDFIDEASSKGVAEIETARLALQKGQSAEVRQFAQQMINDHTAANNELKQIAQRKNLKVADEAELMNKAKAFILKQRDGESFDEAYANNQVVAHEQTIEVFREGSRSQDADIKAFADKTLPKLEKHLQMARELQNRTQNVKDRRDNDDGSRVNDGRINRGTMDHEDGDHPTTPRGDVDNRETRPGMGTVPQTQHSN
jgi:putative membrane protein